VARRRRIDARCDDGGGLLEERAGPDGDSVERSDVSRAPGFTQGEGAGQHHGALPVPGGLVPMGVGVFSPRMLRSPVMVCHCGFGGSPGHRPARRAVDHGHMGPRDGQQREEGQGAVHAVSYGQGRVVTSVEPPPPGVTPVPPSDSTLTLRMSVSQDSCCRADAAGWRNHSATTVSVKLESCRGFGVHAVRVGSGIQNQSERRVSRPVGNREPTAPDLQLHDAAFADDSSAELVYMSGPSSTSRSRISPPRMTART